MSLLDRAIKLLRRYEEHHDVKVFLLHTVEPLQQPVTHEWLREVLGHGVAYRDLAWIVRGSPAEYLVDASDQRGYVEISTNGFVVWWRQNPTRAEFIAICESLLDQ